MPVFKQALRFEESAGGLDDEERGLSAIHSPVASWGSAIEFDFLDTGPTPSRGQALCGYGGNARSFSQNFLQWIRENR